MGLDKSYLSWIGMPLQHAPIFHLGSEIWGLIISFDQFSLAITSYACFLGTNMYTPFQLSISVAITAWNQVHPWLYWQYSRFDGISLAINLHSEIWSFFFKKNFSSSEELILRNLEFFKHFFFFFESVIVNMGKQKPIMCYDYVVSTRRDNFISLYSTRKLILYFLEN